MIEIVYTPNFIRRYKKLNHSLQEEVKEKIGQFQFEDNHFKLKVHKLQGKLDKTMSFSVNYKIRIIFEFGKNNKVANLFSVGDHDDLY